MALRAIPEAGYALASVAAFGVAFAALALGEGTYFPADYSSAPAPERRVAQLAAASPDVPKAAAGKKAGRRRPRHFRIAAKTKDAPVMDRVSISNAQLTNVGGVHNCGKMSNITISGVRAINSNGKTVPLLSNCDEASMIGTTDH
jgi:hypothetical protein